jgi:hypothetical protein
VCGWLALIPFTPARPRCGSCCARRGKGEALTSAWQGIRRSPTLKEFFERVTRGGEADRRKIALVATAHHLARVMAAMLRTGEVWREREREREQVQPDAMEKTEEGRTCARRVLGFSPPEDHGGVSCTCSSDDGVVGGRGRGRGRGGNRVRRSHG